MPPQRGSALVELLLSAPVLLIIALFLLDFGRGYKAQQRTQRSARHLAWAQGRQEEYPGAQEQPPSAAGAHQLHFEAVGETPQTQVRDFEELVTGYRVARVVDLEKVRSFIRTLSFGLVTLEHEAFDFVAGHLKATRSETSQHLGAGILRILKPGALKSKHTVSLWAHVDDDPSDPVGWWDPWESLKGLLP